MSAVMARQARCAACAGLEAKSCSVRPYRALGRLLGASDAVVTMWADSGPEGRATAVGSCWTEWARGTTRDVLIVASWARLLLAGVRASGAFVAELADACVLLSRH